MSEASERELLGDKIKALEKESETFLDSSLPVVVRLDGVAFHTYTTGFKKPSDDRISTPMIETTKDLVKRFNCLFGYTESDEITLILSPTPVEGYGKSQPLYNNRVQKLASIFAAYASVRFNYHLSALAKTSEADRARDKMVDGSAFFDARVFNVPDMTVAMEAVYWRHRYDCRRNSIAAVARAHFSSKELHGKNSAAMLKMLDGIGIKYTDYPAHLRYGTFVKHMIVKKSASEWTPTDGGRKPEGDYFRSSLKVWSEPMPDDVGERVRLVSNKYYNQSEAESWTLSK